VARFGRSSTMVAAAPNGAPAPRFASAVAVQMRAPPSVKSKREALVWRLDDGDLLRRKRFGFGWQRRMMEPQRLVRARGRKLGRPLPRSSPMKARSSYD
jgi:hypothetical protein